MNTRAMHAIVRRDLKIVAQTKGVLLPMIIVPVLLLVILPGIIAFVPALVPDIAGELDELGRMLEAMPEGLRQNLATYTPAQQWIALTVLYTLAPLYLIAPLMVASVIAADSFAGEKERKTLEALLYTPTTDRELFVAKMLSAWLPAVGVAWLGFLVYAIMANLSSWQTMGRLFFPNAMWVVLALWVAPAVAGLGLGVTVLVSARAKSFQEAYQLGGVLVLPIILLMVGQATGVMYFSTGLVFLLGVAFWAIDVALLWFGGQAFQRSEVIAQLG